MTTEKPADGAVTFMVAMPSPVEETEHVADPQARVALPLATVKETVTPPAGARVGERAVTVNGMGTPMGTVPAGALFRVSESPLPES